MQPYRELPRRVFKALRLLRAPTWRRGLRRRVGAAVEHDRVAFGADFRAILDVGAHRGQFALFALHRFPRARILCFEPLAEARATLESVLAGRSDASIFPVALGSRSGRTTMHVTRRNDSSSLLVPTERQVEAFPGTEEAAQRDVELSRLDDVLGHTGPLPRPCLLKIDVQGNELEVLRGGLSTLDRVDEILVECSFTELYEGQPRADDVVALLRGRGFRMAGVFSVVKDRGGRQLQGDFLFTRTDL